MKRALLGVWLSRLREEHDPQLVVSLDPSYSLLPIDQLVGVSPGPDKVIGISVAILLYAKAVLVDLLCLTGLSSLSYATDR